MSASKLYKQLYKELSLISKNSFKVHAESDLKKRSALLQYKKMQYIKEGKSTKELEEQLKKESSLEAPKVNTDLIKALINENETPSKRHLNNLTNITTFLGSQRVYQELLERYNPGMTMDQMENVKRTANRVGLDADF